MVEDVKYRRKRKLVTNAENLFDSVNPFIIFERQWVSYKGSQQAQILSESFQSAFAIAVRAAEMQDDSRLGSCSHSIEESGMQTKLAPGPLHHVLTGGIEAGVLAGVHSYTYARE